MKTSLRDPAFRHRLREALRVTAVSQRQLANKLGVDSAAVNRWLTGRTEPVRISYESIARAVGVPLDMVAPVVARRVTVPSGAGNVSIPILSDAAGEPQTLELPEWLVLDWFGGAIPGDERAIAVRLEDDSLAPAILPGSVLVLDTSESTRGWPAKRIDGRRIYAIRSRPGGPIVFRRASFDGRAIICEPVNLDRKRYPVTVLLADATRVPSLVPAVVVGKVERMGS